MWKKCKIIMLPTERQSDIFLYDGAKKLGWGKELCNKAISHKFYHFYILSDEEIKEGDWYICWETINSKETNHIVAKATKKDSLDWYNGADNYKKIIATTDNSLTSFPVGNPMRMIQQIPQSFISYYIEEYNKGNAPVDVEVEYWEKIHNQYSPAGAQWIEYIVATDSNNCISIKRSKECWTREEVIKLCESARNNGYMKGIKVEADAHRDNNLFVGWDLSFEKWIEQNL